MPDVTTAIRPVLAGFVSALLGISGAAFAGFTKPRPLPAPPTPQARIALDFFAQLENGQIEPAFQSLDPALRKSYSLSQLQRAAGSFAGIHYNRRISYQGLGRSSKMAAQTRGPSQLVCIVNTPESGNGSILYSAAFLREDGSSHVWKITDFRIDSQPHPSCVVTYPIDTGIIYTRPRTQ
jgi:hypothetical protein